MDYSRSYLIHASISLNSVATRIQQLEIWPKVKNIINLHRNKWIEHVVSC